MINLNDLKTKHSNSLEGKEEEVGVGNQKKHSNSLEGGGGLMDPNETLIHGDEAVLGKED
jgi:hypothetical protein